jgi:putative ABC transport system ATP-binding protein
MRIAVAAIFRFMLIVARDLEQTYQSAGRPLTVLKSVDLEIAREEFVAIVGPSGSGKTTLLGLLAGLDRPSRGTVVINGQDLNRLTEDQRARFRAENIGFVFQTFQLIPTLTALENVMVPVELVRRSRNGEAETRAADLLDRVGLADRLGHYPAQLSGGEQQRVALARAFANEPKILFADEPTGNLDTETGQRVIDLLVGLNQQIQTTLVMVTHDVELATRARRIVRLSGGRMISDKLTSAPPE